MKVECPYCKEEYDIKRKQLGREAVCAMCNNTFILFKEGVAPIVPTKRNNKKILLIVLISVVAVGLIGGGVFFAIKKGVTLQMLKFWEKPAIAENSEEEEKDTGSITKAKWLASQNNLKQIGTAIAMYKDENKDSLPKSLNDLLVSKQLTDLKVYIAPFDEQSVAATDTLDQKNTTYAYIGQIPKSAARIPVAFEKPWLLPEGWDKLNILYSDGSVSTETMEGVSKMTCAGIVKALTKDFQDKKVAEQLLKNAEKIDSSRSTESAAP